MAVIVPTECVQDPEGKLVGWCWAAVTENDTCQAVRITKNDVTMSVSGTIGGATATLVIDGITSSTVSLSTANTGALATEGGISYVPTFTGGSSQSANVLLTAQ